MPADWKLGILYPVGKPKKPLTCIESYRPITLLPVMAKIMERIIMARLEWHLESNNLLSPTQCGFRKGRSTFDQVTRLEIFIRNGLSQNNTIIVFFLDLQGAFDRVWHMLLLYKLKQLNIRGRLLGWLYSCLLDRKFQVFFEGCRSSIRSVRSGVPQGAAISPILFNVLLYDIMKVNNVIYSEYAYDVANYSAGNNVQQLVAVMQEALDQFSQWCTNSGQLVSVTKTKAIYFSKSLKILNPLYVLGRPVEYVETFKFLGVIFDSPTLIWKLHIENVKNKCMLSFPIMKSLANYKWGSDRCMLLRIYISIIRSRMDYCCHVYSTASSTNLKMLDVIQNQCIRLALGARQTSPIVSLEVEANIPPLSIRRKYLTLKYYNKILDCPVTSPACVNQTPTYS